MPSVNIQFHMLYDELCHFIAMVRSQLHLEVELESFFPPGSKKVPPEADLVNEIEKFGSVDRFWLLYTPAKSKKPERFMLNVGRLRGDRLAQAQLGAGTSNADAYAVLKRVATHLKKQTSAGVWVKTEIGTVGFAKSFRVSEGAASQARAKKVELVSPMFTQSFHVDAPEELGK